jgi:hypothetical protein
MSKFEPNFTVFWNGAQHEPKFATLESAIDSAVRISSRPDFKGEAVYIFNIDQGHTEKIYVNWKEISK